MQMLDLPGCFAKAVGGDAGVAEWDKTGVAEVRLNVMLT